jgi:hypothetical protein
MCILNTDLSVFLIFELVCVIEVRLSEQKVNYYALGIADCCVYPKIVQNDIASSSLMTDNEKWRTTRITRHPSREIWKCQPYWYNEEPTSTRRGGIMNRYLNRTPYPKDKGLWHKQLIVMKLKGVNREVIFMNSEWKSKVWRKEKVLKCGLQSTVHSLQSTVYSLQHSLPWGESLRTLPPGGGRQALVTILTPPWRQRAVCARSTWLTVTFWRVMTATTTAITGSAAVIYIIASRIGTRSTTIYRENLARQQHRSCVWIGKGTWGKLVSQNSEGKGKVRGRYGD